MAAPRVVVGTMVTIGVLGLLGASPLKNHANPGDSFKEQSALWARTHSPTKPYSFLTQTLCECAGSATPMIVTVSDGKVSGARPLIAGAPSPPALLEVFQYSIEDLIRVASEAAAKGASVTVRWHPVYGYPTYLHIDPSKEWVDDDITYEVLLLHVPPAS